MLNILYILIIWPLEILFEFIFSVSEKILKGNIVLSILSLSISVGVLTLPLYRKADKLQEANKEKQLFMEPMIAHIKKTFKGDERFMMLQAYYRQNEYKPIHALRGTVSLFLQIPFFVAAYHFLSGLPKLNNVSLGPITNLGKPDALIVVGNFQVNVLPVLMTVINIVAGAIYTKNQPLKTKIQLYGIAVVFLILLYESPSGLVLYWTFNNIFSLLKNIAEKIFKNNKSKAETINQIARKEKNEFWVGSMFLVLFVGCYIPSSIIKSSPTEFVDIWNPQNPIHYILYSLLLSTGTFIIWMGIYYLLSDKKIKSLFSEFVFLICITGIVNYCSLGTKLSYISSSLQYEKYDIFNDFKLKILNLIVISILLILAHIFYTKFRKVIFGILISMLISASILVVYNILNINSEYQRLINMGLQAKENEVSIPLSTKGNNVMIFVLDRAMGTQVPYIFNEKPELVDSFDGFVYYKNTVSFGGFTHFGAPPIYGGYEYTPYEMNQRPDESMKDKYDESLKVLPVLFDENGYEVTMCDPPFAGFSWTPDLSIYDDYPNINAYITEGKYWGDSNQTNDSIEETRERNFFCNSIMRISPMIFWVKIYDYGLYNHYNDREKYQGVQVCESRSIASGYKEDFLKWYYVLDNYENIYKIKDDETDTFLIMYNCTTHEPAMLQEPDYIPQEYVDNTEYDQDLDSRYILDGVKMDMSSTLQVIHYHANMAAMIKLAELFDWMREEDVYDNTRIIIVADHGTAINQFDKMISEELDAEIFMPLLMMKDYNASGFTTDETFMTNADGVAFAVKDIIENPINPFTGNSLLEQNKENIRIEASLDIGFDTIEFLNVIPKSKWYTVHDDIYDMSNWEYLGEY